MDLHYKQEVTVGTLVLVGALLFIGGSMWLQGKDFKRGEHTRIVFPEVGNLKVASPVAVAGVQVGKVQSIELVDIQRVVVAISLPEKIGPKADATAEIVSLSLTAMSGIDFDPAARRRRSGRARWCREPGTGLRQHRCQPECPGPEPWSAGVQELVDTQMARQLRATSAAAQATLLAAQRTMEEDPR